MESYLSFKGSEIPKRETERLWEQERVGDSKETVFSRPSQGWCTYELTGYKGVHWTCTRSSQRKSQHGREVGMMSCPSPRSCWKLTVAGRGEMGFPQWSGTGYINHVPGWAQCSGVVNQHKRDPLRASSCCCYKRERSKFGWVRGLQGIREELGEGKNLIKICCMKFSKNKLKTLFLKQYWDPTFRNGLIRLGRGHGLRIFKKAFGYL